MFLSKQWFQQFSSHTANVTYCVVVSFPWGQEPNNLLASETVKRLDVFAKAFYHSVKSLHSDLLLTFVKTTRIPSRKISNEPFFFFWKRLIWHINIHNCFHLNPLVLFSPLLVVRYCFERRITAWLVSIWQNCITKFIRNIPIFS